MPRLDSYFQRTMEARQARYERAIEAMHRPLWQEAARAGFLTCVVLADFLLPPELALTAGVWGWPVLGLSLVALIAVQVWVYVKVWGPEGRWTPKPRESEDL